MQDIRAFSVNKRRLFITAAVLLLIAAILLYAFNGVYNYCSITVPADNMDAKTIFVNITKYCSECQDVRDGIYCGSFEQHDEPVKYDGTKADIERYLEKIMCHRGITVYYWTAIVSGKPVRVICSRDERFPKYYSKFNESYNNGRIFEDIRTTADIRIKYFGRMYAGAYPQELYLE